MIMRSVVKETTLTRRGKKNTTLSSSYIYKALFLLNSLPKAICFTTLSLYKYLSFYIYIYISGKALLKLVASKNLSSSSNSTNIYWCCAEEYMKMAISSKWRSSGVFLLIVMNITISYLSVGTMGAAPKKPVGVAFGRNYVPTWAFDHIKYFNAGSEIQLLLDNYTGTGFQSKGSYLFGHFSMQIKMVPGDSAGTVTAFYLSSQNNEHDEIDFEFLGNRTGQPYILQTNVFTGGKGNREQRIYLWFDPTKDYHSYSVLWNLHQIVFFVDDIPIRVFKNSKDLGVKFPFDQPMKIYNSLWNADDWATRGGLEKTDWSKGPFVAAYKSFHVDGCESSVHAKFCATRGKHWWDKKEFRDLDSYQYRRLKWVRSKYTIYNYCTDKTRYPTMPLECKRDRDNI